MLFRSRGDYASAVHYLSEALDYAPDDPDIQQNLDRAREALRQSEAAQQLKSVQHHSQIAAHLGGEAASAEARMGFDTAGVDAGTLDLPVSVGAGTEGDPVVLPSQRTVKIRIMEWQRERTRRDLDRLAKRCQALDPQKDAPQIARIEQQQLEKQGEIRKLNLSITEQLRTAATPKSEPAPGGQP